VVFEKFDMKNITVLLILSGLVLQASGCGGGETATANQAPSANSSPAQPQPTVAEASTPLPQFTDAETAFAEGNKLFDRNENELAVEAYRQATTLNPDHAEAWFKLGIAYSLIEKEKQIEAENSLEVTETPTPAPTPRAKKGKKEPAVVRTKDSEKAFEKAVAAYKKWLVKNPDDDLAHYNLGRTYNKLDEDEDALKALRQAVKLKPEAIEYQIELGAILNKLAEYDESVRVLKKAVDLDPENSEAVELLEKAEAGKKRINFGVTPKPPAPTQEKAPRTKEPDKTEDPEAPATAPTTSAPAQPKPTAAAKPTAAKPTDKKGNQ
jgi:Flp pilus assembly protein TadD